MHTRSCEVHGGTTTRAQECCEETGGFSPAVSRKQWRGVEGSGVGAGGIGASVEAD